MLNSSKSKTKGITVIWRAATVPDPNICLFSSTQGTTLKGT